jgi:molecular chaperone GrpE
MFGKRKNNGMKENNHKQEEENIDANDMQEQNDGQSTEAADDKQQKIDELQDKYLRLHAEFDNFRRRTAKERLELIQQANKDLILNILPIYDDFQRALGAFEKSDNKEALEEGVRLIFNKFTNVLNSVGVKPIEATGKGFDPEEHDAVTRINAGPDMSGKVVDEIQKGYTLNDKIIRHSKVVVGE